MYKCPGCKRKFKTIAGFAIHTDRCKGLLKLRNKK